MIGQAPPCATLQERALAAQYFKVAPPAVRGLGQQYSSEAPGLEHFGSMHVCQVAQMPPCPETPTKQKFPEEEGGGGEAETYDPGGEEERKKKQAYAVGGILLLLVVGAGGYLLYRSTKKR